jgi:hypothetical protein
LRADRTRADEIDDGARRLEEPREPSGWRSVDHDEVVDVAALLASSLGLFDLSDQQDVAQAGGRVGRELDGFRARQRSTHPPDAVEELEVLAERLLGRHRKPVHAVGELLLAVSERPRPEGPADCVAPLDLDEEHPFPRSRRGERQCGGDGRLANASFSGHDGDAR